MSIELISLALAAGLLLLLTLMQGTRNVLVLGLPTAAGNQHNIEPWQGWHDRLNRAVRNQIEAIAIYAPVVLTVYTLDLANTTSALGAQLFVLARAVHAVVYIIGIPYARTAAWFAGILGTVLVASPLFA